VNNTAASDALAIPVHAQRNPMKPAVVLSTADHEVVLSYQTIDEQSRRGAAMFYEHGLKPGDHIAIYSGNRVGLICAIWAAERAGLYYTPVNSMLQSNELEFIVANSESKALVASALLSSASDATFESTPDLQVRFAFDSDIAGYLSFEAEMGKAGAHPHLDEVAGMPMLYSAGTTGRPKGVLRDFGQTSTWTDPMYLPMYTGLYGLDRDSVWLSTGPLYHSGPLYGFLAGLRAGATVVVMDRFDAERALALIDRYGVTHSQWVPTMFSRLLKLPAEVRARYSLSTLGHALHGSAPCPVAVKEQIIDWWGPILYEFYGGTEGNGMTLIDAKDWLEHKGSVGRPVLGAAHIVDENGEQLDPMAPGLVYFDGGAQFEYHGDQEATVNAHLENGWSTLDDIGYLDEDGYLYLTDRASFTIISGGVNIYPREAEDVLIGHPAVGDVAVIGVPNDDLGEEVKAIVEAADGVTVTEDLAAEIVAFCRDRLAHYKCPRSIDFVEALPRLPSGKLEKRKIRDPYWHGHQSRIA
jgi:long-chain acyl-CoA synthetase